MILSITSLIPRLQLFLLIAVGLLSACAVGPDFKQPEAPKTLTYTEEPLSKTLTIAPGVPGGTDQVFVDGADIEAQWWELYKSPELDVLIKKALQKNPNLGAADAALRAAQENVNAQIGGQYVPAIGIGALGQPGLSGGREKQPSAVYGLQNGTDTYNLYNATVNVTYKIDVFGGGRRTVESAKAQAEYQQFKLESAYLSLTANIVTGAIREAALRAQLQATAEILKALLNLI